jgi:hypothetical protein
VQLDWKKLQEPKDPRAFLPRRWIVERTFSWLGQNRRMSKDYERLPQSAEALIYVAMSRLMLRRLARSCGFSDSFGRIFLGSSALRRSGKFAYHSFFCPAVAIMGYWPLRLISRGEYASGFGRERKGKHP